MPTSSATKTILTAAHWGPMLVETDGENVLSSRGALATPFANSLQTAVRDQVHSKTLSLIHISEPTRRVVISYAVFCLKKIFFNDTATTEIYTRLFVGSVRCV